MSNRENIPILPIPNMVFFPNTSLPLYIVEPIYVQLIYHCVEHNIPLGVAMPQNLESVSQNFNLSRQVCGIGRPVILEQIEDGSLKILIKGIGRAKLIHEEQKYPFSLFQIERYYDTKNNLASLDQEIERLKNILMNWLNQNIDEPYEREAFIKTLSSPYHIVDYICMLLIQDNELRQLLLENDSFNERVYMLNLLLKEHDPYTEDIFVLSAIKNFETIEHQSKTYH